jgi:hypothetical protein
MMMMMMMTKKDDDAEQKEVNKCRCKTALLLSQAETLLGFR